MKNMLYVIFDRLTNRYTQVFCSATDASASRYFSDVVLSQTQHKEDYELCRVGAMEIESGLCETYSPVRVDFTQFTNPVLQVENNG